MQIEIDAQEMDRRAGEAAAFLKSMANKHRLMILCALAEGERSAGALAARLGISAANASQHLFRLRSEKLVETRREGTTIHYRLASRHVRPLIEVLYREFCTDSPAPSYDPGETVA